MILQFMRQIITGHGMHSGFYSEAEAGASLEGKALPGKGVSVIDSICDAICSTAFI